MYIFAAANTTDTTDTAAEIAEQLNPVEKLTQQVIDIGNGFFNILPNLAIGIFVILVTWIVAKLARKLADRIIRKADLRPSLRELIETLISVAIWIVGIMIAATVMIPSLTPAGMLAGLGLGTVAIGFAFQDIFENFLAGVLIMIRKKMRIGDVIQCEGITGRVEHITLRETHVRRLSGEITIVPNSMLFKNPVEIMTDDPQRRHEIIAGVSYDTDLEMARDVIRKAVETVDEVDKDRRIDVFACEFNSSSVDFRVRWWSGSKPYDMHNSKDLVIRAIKRALDDANIEIPFPYVTHTFKEAMKIEKGNDNGTS